MVSATAMAVDSAGRFRYNYLTSTGASNGDYTAAYTTVNDGVKTVSTDTFTVADKV
jgi:hypothetical protein